MKTVFHLLSLAMTALALALGGLCCTCCSADAAAITGDRYDIVIPDQASSSERTAALELSMYLGRVTGDRFAVVEESNRAADRKGIFVGQCEYTRKTGRVDYAKLGLEGIRIFADNGHLVLTGDRRGVLYAVYEFLERYTGCRWFAEECIVVPKMKKLELPAVDLTYIPPLEYRDTDYLCIYSQPRLIVANRLNGSYAFRRIRNEWGGAYQYKGFVHTFNQLVPPEKYGKEHPEYFSEINGKRKTEGRTQLCLTNPDVLAIVIREVKNRLREAPDAIVSISQNDWREYCCCKSCTELAEKEGSQSGPLIHFVNAVARAVRDEYPHAIIDTLAYQYTRKPPLHVKAEPNVVIRLCSIECCFAHSFEDDPFNESFVRDLENWGKCCSRLHFWDYIINYRCPVSPFPNFRVIAPNIRFLEKHSVTGIYEEANYFSRGGEFEQLRAYITARCLWDPSYDVEMGIMEFTDAYYGKAAPAIRKYIDLMHDHVTNAKDRHMRIWDRPEGYLDKAVLDKAMPLFAEAQAAVADDPVLLKRVEMALMPVLFVRLYMRVDEGDVRAAMIDRFEELARRVPNIRLSESRAATLEKTLEDFRKPAPAKK